VFGLFIIEAAFIKKHFDQLDTEEKRTANLRGHEADRDFEQIERRLQAHENDAQMQAYTLARERIRCPLLDDNQDCILYLHRPITCRVYGIPTKIQGKAHVCGKTGFKSGEYYPAFDLDEIYRDLYNLSKELLGSGGKDDLERASLLISVSKAIKTPMEGLINKSFG
jgi:Fe-S-cluster containining protein